MKWNTKIRVILMMIKNKEMKRITWIIFQKVNPTKKEDFGNWSIRAIKSQCLVK